MCFSSIVSMSIVDSKGPNVAIISATIRSDYITDIFISFSVWDLTYIIRLAG